MDILAEDLEARATELRDEFGIDVRPIGVDLADLSVYPRLMGQVVDIDIDVLVCDHMYTPKDTPKILDMPLDVHNAMIDINARG